MRILAIGDFHGEFPEKLKRKIKKEKPDLILSTGDYANADKIRKLIFKHWTDKKWYDIVGLKKAKKLEKESFNSGLAILKKLNSIGKKIYTIWGNTDFYRDYTTSEPTIIMPGFYEDKISKMKNIILIDKKKRKIKDLEIVGHGGYVDVTDFIKTPVDKDKEKQKKRLKRYRKDEAKLKNLFLKKKLKKGFIFLIHYTPYRFFDIVKFKQSPMYGRHVGWEPYNRIIKKYKPSLVVCGHMHEYQGLKRLEKTAIISTGSAQNAKAVIIDFDEKKKKVIRIKFIK